MPCAGRACFDSAVTAKSLAASIKSGSIAPLKLGLSPSINMALVLPQLTQIAAAFKGLEMKFLRGVGPDIEQLLKKGMVDLVVAGHLRGDWERLDHWTLFTEGFFLSVNDNHPLAGRSEVDIQELKDEPFVRRAHCENVADLDSFLSDHGITMGRRHEAWSEDDVASLLMANAGVALVPASTILPASLRQIRVRGLDLKRPVSVYGVAGRPRAAVAGTLLKMLRANNWSA